MNITIFKRAKEKENQIFPPQHLTQNLENLHKIMQLIFGQINRVYMANKPEMITQTCLLFKLLNFI